MLRGVIKERGLERSGFISEFSSIASVGLWLHCSQRLRRGEEAASLSVNQHRCVIGHVKIRVQGRMAAPEVSIWRRHDLTVGHNFIYAHAAAIDIDDHLAVDGPALSCGDGRRHDDFIMNGQKLAPDLGVVTADAEIRVASGWALMGKFDGEFGSGTLTYAGTARMRYVCWCPCPRWVCAVIRRRFPVGASPTRQPLQPEATGAVMEATKWLKSSVSVSRICAGKKLGCSHDRIGVVDETTAVHCGALRRCRGTAGRADATECLDAANRTLDGSAIRWNSCSIDGFSAGSEGEWA